MRLRKDWIFTLSIFFVSVAHQAKAVCLDVNETTHACVVTSDRGDITDGSLLQCLSDSRCQKITFGVSRVEPLRAIPELFAGVELDGRTSSGGTITLTYDTEYIWTTDDVLDHRDCLLWVLADGTNTTGAKLSNLTIENPYGRTGICFGRNGARFPNGNILSRLTIRTSGTGRGIDLSLSNNNTLTDITVIAEGGSATSGIALGGDNNRIEQGRIENFNNGIIVASTGGGNVITRVNYYAIRIRPIHYGTASGRTNRPQNIRTAFVTSSEWTLTGRAPEVTSNLEIYKVEGTSGNRNFIYKSRVPVVSYGRGDHEEQSALAPGIIRFVNPRTVNPSGLRGTDSMAVTGQVANSTTEFSAVYSGTPAPVLGSTTCRDSDWFWASFDYPKMTGGTESGWHVDYDGDLIPNGPCATCAGLTVDQSEDQNKNCQLDLGESRPEEWRSQYDLDCDGRADHQYVNFRAVDNCVLAERGDGTEYSESDADQEAARAACDRSDPSNPAHEAAFGSWNPNQLDSDNDGLGDECESDPDNDGLPDGLDNCPTVYNPDQRNSDEREDRTVMPPLLGTGDVCEPIRNLGLYSQIDSLTDLDYDGTDENVDNCPGMVNIAQRDLDHDGIGDYCDPSQRDDRDGDGRRAAVDNCPYDYNPDQLDTDDDRVGDKCDFDDDSDGLVDVEEDFNKDGVIDPNETDPKNPDSDLDGLCDGPGWGFNRISCIRPLDNCPHTPNRDQVDADEDGIGDLCDADPSRWLGLVDSDGDGVLDSDDNCPHIPNNNTGVIEDFVRFFSQNDWDEDGSGDPCDSDDDNDGLDDVTENGMFDPGRREHVFPYSPNYLKRDSDGDGVYDGVDVCPNYPFECENRENLSNPACENIIANPIGDRSLLPESLCGGYPADDVDGDGIRNNIDNCVFIPNRRQLNVDGDAQGDACDLDDDNDDNTNALEDECRTYLQTQGVQPRNGIGCNSAERICRHCDIDESANVRLHPWDPNSDHQNGMVFGYADLRCDGGGTGFGFQNSLTRCVAADPCPEYFNPIGAENACGSGLVPSVSDLPDIDLDLVPNEHDVCPNDPDPSQADLNRNGVGDACDPDIDGDAVLNEPNDDNCPTVSNPSQTDTDGDGLGDDCDPNPFSKNVAQISGSGVTAGGCGSIVQNQKRDPSSSFLPLLTLSVLLLLRRQKNFR